MSITVTSNPETGELITTNSSDLPKPESKAEAKSASTEKSEDETQEESGSLESESEEVEDQESEESEDESEDEEEKVKDDEPKPKKKGFKNRIQKLRSRLSERDQEIEYLREQVRKGKDPGQESQKQEAKVETAGKPNPDNFDSHEAYVEAVAEWKYEQKESARKAAEQQTALKADYEKLVTDHNKRIGEFKKDKPDYDEKVKTFLEDYSDSTGDYQFAPALKEVFTDKLGPAVMYELLNDPDELHRINGLSYGSALRALGHIEARIKKSSESSQEKPTPKQTKAPPPVKPVGSSKAPLKKTIYDSNLTFKEYERLRAEELKNR